MLMKKDMESAYQILEFLNEGSIDAKIRDMLLQFGNKWLWISVKWLNLWNENISYLCYLYIGEYQYCMMIKFNNNANYDS